MKNLFCQTIDFFTGRVIDEEINAKKESTASSELLSRASKIDDEIYKLNKRRTTLCMIAIFAHLLIFLIVNTVLFAYSIEKKGDNLCFASRISVYSIPIFSIKKTYINDKMEYYDGWNKEDSEEDEVYKDSIYIERNRYGQVLRKFMENSYHIEIELNGEMYEIIVPNYDFRELEEIYREI